MKARVNMLDLAIAILTAAIHSPFEVHLRCGTRAFDIGYGGDDGDEGEGSFLVIIMTGHFISHIVRDR